MLNQTSKYTNSKYAYIGISEGFSFSYSNGWILMNNQEVSLCCQDKYQSGSNVAGEIICPVNKMLLRLRAKKFQVSCNMNIVI